MDEVYANSLTVTNTFFDFSIIFRKENIYEEDGRQNKTSEEVSFVRMSPQMAKALAELLQTNVKKYEEEYGKIPAFENRG